MRRASVLFDEVVVGVADSRSKKPFFTLEERISMARKVLASYPNVTVMGFSGLLGDFVVSCGAKVIVRGLRAVSDFEYEFQMAGMNTRINPKVETLFLMASERNQFIASRLVKEVARLGGDISSFVPAAVNRSVRTKYKV